MSVTLAHIQALASAHGIDVTITRGAQTCSLTAVPAKSVAQLVGRDGSYNQVNVDDWLILVADWTLTGKPQKGDLITIDDDTKYYVAHPDDKQPVYQNFNQLDRPAIAWRIHSVPK